MLNPTTLSRAQLLARRCRVLAAADGLAQEQVEAQLLVLPEWVQSGAAIEREFCFEDYYRTMAFVNALAFLVHAEDHHPELLVSYDRVRVRFSTHSTAGVSANDFICAAKVDALYAHEFGAAP